MEELGELQTALEEKLHDKEEDKTKKGEVWRQTEHVYNKNIFMNFISSTVEMKDVRRHKKVWGKL